MLFKKSLLCLAVTAALVGCDDDETIVNPDIGGGQVLLFSTSGEFIDAANVGYLPDMVKFADNNTLVVANEGEPEDDYASDDEGSISIVTIQSNGKVKTVKTLGFDQAQLVGDVRIKPGSTVSEDLEPEYVAVNEAGDTAWVTLQENNAVAVVDLNKKTITSVNALGKRSVSEQAMDITDDGFANPVVGNPANIFALYQPDTIQSIQIDGKDYYVTANEGDDREYGDYEDLEKAKKLTLSSELEGALLDTDMESLRVLVDMGKDEQGVYNELYMTGTRSFSIWNANGELVFDSGAEFEEEVAASLTNVFNTRVDDTDDADDIADLDADEIPYVLVDGTAYFWEGVDARSLKKGVEPEALALHKMGDSTFAYIGLEKQGGFFVYDISNPAQAEMVQYFNRIDYSALPNVAGDLAPEGMVAFEQGGKHYLVAAHELSSSLAIYELASDGSATKLDSLVLGSFGAGASEIVDYDAQGQALFVTNAETQMVDIVDVSTPSELVKKGSVDFSAYADDLQSVAVKNGVLAIAVKRREVE